MPLVEKEIYCFDRFVLDSVERILSCEGIPVSLTQKAFDTLLCLLRNQGRMVTKDELLKQVWPDTFVEEVNLAVNISLIRKALGDNLRDSSYIATVPRRGYRFVAKVQYLAKQNGNGNGSAATSGIPPELQASSAHERDHGLEEKGFAPVRRKPSLSFGPI